MGMVNNFLFYRGFSLFVTGECLVGGFFLHELDLFGILDSPIVVPQK